LSSPEIMKKVIEAEKEAHRILDQAEREIAEMKKDLPNRIALIRQQILAEATKQKEQVLTEGERISVEEAERIASESSRQVKALSQIPEAKRKKAVERAIEFLFS
jgi:vacuolar-type H+-ATPase subunit H